MPAAEYDIYIEQGSTFMLSMVWKDSGDTPVDVTGYKARMQVRKSHGSDDIQLDGSSDTGEIVLGGSAGTIEVAFSASDTAALTITGGVYDLEVEDAAGKVTRLLQGAAEISKEVTR